MNLRRNQVDEPELNVIPLLDIVFILLIFFIVTTSFNRDTEINITLPVADADPLVVERKIIEISIDADGLFYVNGHGVISSELETLKLAIKKIAEDFQDPPIVISADAKTPHQAVITAMNAVQQLGFVHLTFATQPPPDTP
jgi:biopolymer transport protein ExbD